LYVITTVLVPIAYVLDVAWWVVTTIRDEFPYRPRRVGFREAYRLVKRYQFGKREAVSSDRAGG